MYQRKTLQELTISNNFLFGAVMLDENNCQRFLELALDIPIGHVEVSREKSLVYHPEYKGVRLDVFAKDENQTCFNVEMQVVQRSSLGKRSRYYHSHMDMERSPPAGNTRSFPLPGSSFSVTLILLAAESSATPSAAAAWRTAGWIWETSG